MGSSDGERWTDSDGTVHTVNSTNDPGAAGGYYHSQKGPDGSHATAVYNADGSFADVPANNQWQDVPTQ